MKIFESYKKVQNSILISNRLYRLLKGVRKKASGVGRQASGRRILVKSESFIILGCGIKYMSIIKNAALWEISMN